MGDLGNIRVNTKGICRETFIIEGLQLEDIVGRSLIIHEDEDDLGVHKNDKNSIKTGNSGNRVMCGIIGIGVNADEC